MEQRIYRLARAGGIETNPTTFIQRAATFASAATGTGGATLLTRREATGLNGYLILPEASLGSNAPLHLAHTVGARAEDAQMPDDLGDTPVIGTLTFRPSPALRETQSGIDPGELPRLLANAMAEGTWVAVTLRKPSNKERRNYSVWLANRLGTAVPTHHSVSPSAVVVSITAGGSTREEVRALLAQVTAGLPGFDLDTDVRFAPSRSRALPAGITAMLLALAGIFGSPYLPAAVHARIPSFTTGLLWAVAVASALLAAAAASGKISSPETKLRAALDAVRFAAPRNRGTNPRPPRKERTIKQFRMVNGDKVPYDKVIPASDGDYPLHAAAFLVGPSVVVGMVSPHAGAVSGASSTRARATPPAMLRRIGPLLGTNDDGNVYLSADSLRFSAAIVGRPGSGKSLLVRFLFGWSCLERIHPSGIPGAPGRNNALIAFESKGDGASKYREWAEAMGDRTVIVDAADPATPAIDLFAVPGDNAARASFFTNAMRYAFGEQAIGDRSYETLVSVFTAALAVDDALIESMGDRDERVFRTGMSAVYYASLLLGGYTDAAGVQLHAAIVDHEKVLRGRGETSEALAMAVTALAPLYDGKTESARRPFLEAPRNKVSQLFALEEWWTPARPKIAWQQVLEGHRSVVVNTGSSLTGVLLDDSQNQQLSSMLMYSLQNALKRFCSGWLDQSRSVSIFADELSLLAGSSPEVIGWIRDQGRSYGIRAFLATQRPEQLGAALRNNFLTYSTLISFAQTDVSTAAEVALNVGTNNDWSSEDIQLIDPYHVVVRSEVDQRRQSAFIVKLPHFEADKAGFVAAQGYAVEEAGLPW